MFLVQKIIIFILCVFKVRQCMVYCVSMSLNTVVAQIRCHNHFAYFYRTVGTAEALGSIIQNMNQYIDIQSRGQ